MNKVNSTFHDKIIRFLFQPYPFYYHGKNLWIVASLLFVMTIFFNYIFEPFEVYIPEHKMDHFWISSIHACTSVVIIGLLSLIKITSKSEENWNVRKEILLITFFLLLVGIAQFLIRDIIYNNPNNWSWKYLYEEIRNTLLIGTLFAIILTSLNYNRLNKKYIKNANALDLFTKELEPRTNSIVFIKTQVISDAFELDLNSFLFAKADGNYVELYLNENKINKVIKRITLKELESTLELYPNIIRTHRSYLINLHHIKSVVGNAQGYKLRLNNNDEMIPVSRNMIKEFDARVNTI